ncbi:MAG: methyltransferase domain-containing protein [Alphaproteobacteria bacterium]|nr:methyltransferase domain-containing protein [Alphaproteobacteria bacterium]
MKVITEAEEISNIAFGFMASKALFVALHLDVFTKLSGDSKNAKAIAQEAGVPENRVLTIMTVLTTMGLVTREGDAYTNSPGAEAFLVQGARYDFSDYLRLQIDRQMYPFMQQLEGVVTDNLSPDDVDSYAKWMENEEEARLYSESQHAGSLGPGRTLARMVDFSGVDHLLDVAGGTGGFAIRLCQANPNLRVTILDFPNVVALGREKVAEAGLSDRIEFIGGNALESEWPSDVGAVLMSYLFSGVPGDAIPELARHAYDVTRPGGLYLVHDFMVEDDRSGPTLAALWQLQHLAFTPDARSSTPSWVAGIMEGAGFGHIETETLIPGMTKLVWGRKPE